MFPPRSPSLSLRAAAVLLLGGAGIAPPLVAETIHVPGDHATIQGAIDAALDGDVVLVETGVWTENLLFAHKSITLTSRFRGEGDPLLIENTILDGGGGTHVVRVDATAGVATTIQGFTLRNADDGVTASAPFRFLDNRVTQTKDGIDFEDGSGGLVRGCRFDGNLDDGIDLDDAVAVTIEECIIRDNLDDGIEIRLHDYVGPEIRITVRDCVIANNGEDGIQLIDDQLPSSRVFRFERNLFLDNRMAGIGMMCCQNTVENYEGASLAEPIELVNNTFVGNDHGVVGGDLVIAVNNLFVDCAGIAVKRVDGNSIVTHALFHGNGTPWSETNLDPTTIGILDPELRSNHHLLPTSRAIDTGTASFTWHGRVVVDLAPEAYEGSAPDLGAFEFAITAIPILPSPLFSGFVISLLVVALPGLRRRALASS